MAKTQCALKLPGGVPAHVGTNRTVLDYGKLAFNARTAMEIFPCMAGAHIVRAWAGIEGMMADDIPVIGASSTSEGVWHAFGFSAPRFPARPDRGCHRGGRRDDREHAISHRAVFDRALQGFDRASGAASIGIFPSGMR